MMNIDEIKKEVEGEVYEHLRSTNYGGDKLLESIENTVRLVLNEYDVENPDLTVEFSKGGNISISGVETAIKKSIDNE